MRNVSGAEDQTEVFAFLADPATHGLDRPVVRIETHGACVFLAGRDVYKVKRSVRFPYMDFSTLDKRRRACESEIAVNAPHAPDLYLGVVPITRDGRRLRIGGSGEVVEWAVHLRRFDENATLDRLAERGELGRGLISELATVVLAWHRRAAVRPGPAAVEALWRQATDTLDELGQHTDIFPAPDVGALRSAVFHQLAVLQPLLQRRGECGQVRRCHGDLHLRNIARIDGRPVPFDAIEFDEAIATCDVLYDLSFLIMDLWEKGFRGEASLVLNRYLWGCDDEALQLEGLAALPVFLALRAAIRARVAAELARLSPQQRSRATAVAQHYLQAAVDFIAPRPALLVGIGGLSGTGKSTLAARVAPVIGRPPGAVHLRSDIERKRYLGIGELDTAPAESYTPEVSDVIYAQLRHLAGVALRAGQSVVVDAVHGREDEREGLARVAYDAGAAFTGIWLEAPLELLQTRVAARRGDASDATPAVVSAQTGYAIGAMAWHRLDATCPPDELVQKISGLCGQPAELTEAAPARPRPAAAPDANRPAPRSPDPADS